MHLGLKGPITALLVVLIVAACQPAASSPTTPASGGPGPSASAATGSGEPIKTALITDSAGSTSLFGVANINGARMAVDELNAAGGVLSRPVELIVRDSKSKPDIGVQLTRDAILGDKVSVIFGPVSSAVAAAMTEVAKENKTPIFFHTSNTQRLTTELFHKYAFMVGPNTTMEGRGNAIAAAALPYKKWAVIAPDYEFGHLQSEAFVSKLRQLRPDVEIVTEQFPKLGEKEFTPVITSVLAGNPEAVYSANFAGDLITFTKQAAPLGFFDKVFFTSLYETDALQALGAEAPEGVRGYSRAPFFAIESPTIDGFVKSYLDRYGVYPSDWAIMAYDAVKLWAAGVEKAGSLDADALVSALEGYQFDSIRGTVTIRPVDHQAGVSVYSGTVKQDPEVGFATWTDIKIIPGADVWLSEDEVKAQQP
ncbi:MAG: ABC transporter substrate-binding protein [Chloroflexota bacterium]